MNASRIATAEEQATINAAARSYMAVVLVVAQSIYAAAFDDWSEDAKQACAIAMGLQSLIGPEAFATDRINLEGFAHGIGIALGASTAELNDPATHRVLGTFSQAFVTGRAEAITARVGMKTEGNC